MRVYHQYSQVLYLGHRLPISLSTSQTKEIYHGLRSERTTPERVSFLDERHVASVTAAITPSNLWLARLALVPSPRDRQGIKLFADELVKSLK